MARARQANQKNITYIVSVCVYIASIFVKCMYVSNRNIHGPGKDVPFAVIRLPQVPWLRGLCLPRLALPGLAVQVGVLATASATRASPSNDPSLTGTLAWNVGGAQPPFWADTLPVIQERHPVTVGNLVVLLAAAKLSAARAQAGQTITLFRLVESPTPSTQSTVAS